MVIGITDNMGAEHKWQWYTDWLHRCGLAVECRKLSYKFDNLSLVQECDALLLTGGGDVDPALYGGNSTHKKLDAVDRKRDDFERKVLDSALQSELPLLGICRGLQITNVHFGGSLVLDLEEAGFKSHRGNKDHECRHTITIKNGSLLSDISENVDGNANSSHHQAVSLTGKGLRVSATSDDGVVEALELDDARDQPFFLLVQWHPERMKDFENPLSQNLLRRFLSSIRLKEKIQKKSGRQYGT